MRVAHASAVAAAAVERSPANRQHFTALDAGVIRSLNRAASMSYRVVDALDDPVYARYRNDQAFLKVRLAMSPQAAGSAPYKRGPDLWTNFYL